MTWKNGFSTCRTEQVSWHAAPLPGKGEATVMYMEIYDALTNKHGIVVLRVYFIAILTEPSYDKRPVNGIYFKHKKAKDSYCPTAWSTVELLGSASHFYSNWFLALAALWDEALQEYISMSLQLQVLFHSDCPGGAGPSVEHRIYNYMGREHYQAHMAGHVYTTVKHNCKSTCNKPTNALERPNNTFLQVPHCSLSR